MVRLFRHYIPKSLFVLGFVEILVLFAAIVLGVTVRLNQIDPQATIQYGAHWPEYLTFVLSLYVALLALGFYQAEACRDWRLTLIRLAAGMVLGFIIMSVVSYLFKDVGIWRSIFVLAMGFAAIGILLCRTVFRQVVDLERFKRNIILLGAGKRAQRILELEKSPGASFACVGKVRMGPKETEIPDAVDYEQMLPLAETAARLGADEIVVAIEERRGSLPIHDLLSCKMAGIKVTEAVTFLEQQTGVVDLEAVSPSWLVFSDGFVKSGRVDVFVKRGFDILASLILLSLTMPILIITAVAVKLTSPGPILYRQERVGQQGKVFQVMKFRSMRNDAEKAGAQWAQKNDPRVTPVGRIIRLTRIDEIPQIFNVLRGDMSFVGPRPERPVFVAELAKQIPYYQERHQVKPGITGWAQINYPYGASVEDAYQKLQYDLYYIKNYSIFLDLLVLIQTLRVVLWPDGAR